MLIATSSSSIVLLAIVLLTILVVKCTKMKCRVNTGANCPHVVVVENDNSRKKDAELATLANLQKTLDTANNLNRQNSNSDLQNAGSENANGMKEFEVAKPHFQQKRQK